MVEHRPYDRFIMTNQEWRKCSTCKKSINYGSKYFVCSVSTCSGQRTGYIFCSFLCWDAHVPGAKHRDAAALEEMAPKNAQAAGGGVFVAPENPNVSTAQAGVRRVISGPPQSGSPSASGAGQKLPKDILIVASKLKDYIRAKSDMNTSQDVMSVLSDIVRRVADDAIDRARADGRKTVMDRDFN